MYTSMRVIGMAKCFVRSYCRFTGRNLQQGENCKHTRAYSGHATCTTVSGHRTRASSTTYTPLQLYPTVAIKIFQRWMVGRVTGTKNKCPRYLFLFNNSTIWISISSPLLHCQSPLVWLWTYRLPFIPPADPNVELLVNTSRLNTSGEWVIIYWQGVDKPSNSDWIGLFLLPNTSARIDPKNHAPTKFQVCCCKDLN